MKIWKRMLSIRYQISCCVYRNWIICLSSLIITRCQPTKESNSICNVWMNLMIKCWPFCKIQITNTSEWSKIQGIVKIWCTEFLKYSLLFSTKGYRLQKRRQTWAKTWNQCRLIRHINHRKEQLRQDWLIRKLSGRNPCLRRIISGRNGTSWVSHKGCRTKESLRSDRICFR